MHLQSREIVSPSNRPGRSGKGEFPGWARTPIYALPVSFCKGIRCFFLSRRGSGSGMGGAFADGFLGEQGLLADAIRDFREFALIRSDGGQIVNLTDEVERAERFPNLLVARVDRSDFGA